MDEENLNKTQEEDSNSLEDTKELKNISDFLEEEEKHQDVNGVDMTSYQEEFDHNLEDAELIFKTEVNTKEEMKEDLDAPKKMGLGAKIKQKWNEMSKQNKIVFVVSVTGVLIVVILLIVLLVMIMKDTTKTEPKPSVPDVILKRDNYRYENGKLVFLNGVKELGTYECENKDENLCEVAMLTQDDDFDGVKMVDDKGNPIENRSMIYFNRFVFVRDAKSKSDTTMYLYDIEKSEKIESGLSVKAYDPYENYVIFQSERGTYGLLQFTENEAITSIPYDYDYLGLLPDQNELKLAVGKKENAYYLTSVGTNTILTKAIPRKIVGINEHYVKTKDDISKYHIYNYEGQEILTQINKDYVALLDNYVLYVDNGKLNIIDYDGFKMNYRPIELENTNYNPVSIYKDLKLEKTEKSFDYELNENILNINVYRGNEKINTVLNLYEGKLSANLSLMDYFNGEIIFYSDEEKKNEIGTYTCENKNNIEKDTTSLTNCTLASDSSFLETRGNALEMNMDDKLGAIPLFNSRYVFMKDGDSIKLYDLQAKTTIAPYKSVDTSSYTGIKDLSFVSTSEVSYIAQSASSNKFGVAKITNSGIESVIKFEAESIKKLGNYYVVQNNDGYKLYQLNGTPVEMESKKNPIVDYRMVNSKLTYLKTFGNDCYFVHSLNGDISKSSYNYIELYDEFYAAVINNRVHLYRYDDTSDEPYEYIYEGQNSEEHEEEGLKINLNTYYGQSVNAFAITFDTKAKQIVVQIGNTNGSYTTKKFPITKPEPKPEQKPEPVEPEEEKPTENDKKEEEEKETDSKTPSDGSSLAGGNESDKS